MSSKNPMVSIVIPIYNVEIYLKKCINSILNQNFNDFEIILVNDGSTDSSLDICNEYLKKDTRINLVNKTNGGLSSARNAGLNVAKGKYISFIDPDDCINENYFNILINKAEMNDCDVIVSGYRTVPNNVDIIPSYKLNEVLKGTDFILSSDNVHSKNELCFVWRYLYKLKLIKENKIKFNEKIFIGEDVTFNLEVLVNANKVMAISDILYYYTINNPTSLMRNKFKPNLESSLIKQYEKRYYLSKKYNLINNKKYKIDMANYYVNSIYRMIVTNLKNDESCDFEKEIKRVSNNEMFRSSVKNLGFKYKCYNFKEYIFYLALKFKVYPVLLKAINK